MRTSKRESILQRAIELIEAEGLEAISYESLAEASGLSKSGIIYHFPSRDAIMRGLHEYMAAAWESELEAAAGGPAHEVTESQRLRAMVISLSREATKAELLLELDAHQHAEFNEYWLAVDQRWSPPAAEIGDDDIRLQAYLVQLLADGLWVHDHVHEPRLSRKQRAVLSQRILEMIPDTATSAP